MTTNQAYSQPARMLQIASWIIALLFAIFLNMLGNLLIRDMMFVPRGGPPTLEQFTRGNPEEALSATQRDLLRQRDVLADQAETLNVASQRATKDYTDARESFRNWVATRSVTGDSNQDPAIVARTQKLDALQTTRANWQRQQDALSDQQRALQLRIDQLSKRLAQAQLAAEQRFQKANQRYQLQVFAWRLAFTLPLLLLAVWLFIRFRKARYWPFIYGFGLFALSAFFIELVPYLPSFGGYVRILVGIALIVFAGVSLLRAFQRYVERKRQEMQQSQSERARAVVYEKAIGAYQKKLCPSCDKPWNLGGDSATFCIHCGLKLFKICQCGGRNFAFFPFCNNCGKTIQNTVDTDDSSTASGIMR